MQAWIEEIARNDIHFYNKKPPALAVFLPFYRR